MVIARLGAVGKMNLTKGNRLVTSLMPAVVRGLYDAHAAQLQGLGCTLDDLPNPLDCMNPDHQTAERVLSIFGAPKVPPCCSCKYFGRPRQWLLCHLLGIQGATMLDVEPILTKVPTTSSMSEPLLHFLCLPGPESKVAAQPHRCTWRSIPDLTWNKLAPSTLFL